MPFPDEQVTARRLFSMGRGSQELACFHGNTSSIRQNSCRGKGRSSGGRNLDDFTSPICQYHQRASMFKVDQASLY